MATTQVVKHTKVKKSSDFERAKKARNEANNLLDTLKKKYFDDQINQNKNDPKCLWKVLKKLLPTKCVRSFIDEIKSDDGTTVCDGRAIANVINKFFANIGDKLADKITHPTDFHPPDILPPDNPFSMKLIDVVFVRKELKALDMTNSTGIDGIPAKLFKASAASSGRALTHIFNRTVVSGTIRSEWKTARVTPIFKEGDKCDVSNYRPISILPVVMKILERAIHNQLYNYLTENNILSPLQSGFRKCYSTLTSLLDVTDIVHQSVEDGKGTGILFLDLKKAFDTVNHGLFVKKLGQYCIGNSILKWFTNYMTDRQQIVEINEPSQTGNL